MNPPDGGQDGVIASQLAVLMPALLLLIMLAVQFGLWAHATQLAAAAADTAAATAALPEATLDDAHAAATGLLAQAGNLTDTRIVLDRDTTQATATVTGAAPQVVPGIAWSVSAQAAAPRERFIRQVDR